MEQVAIAVPTMKPRNRLSITFMVAVAFHALVILGVGFSADEGFDDSKLMHNFEVTLVNTQTENAPEDYDYLAQSNQEGGGNTDDQVRPETLTPAMLPKNSPELTTVSPTIISPAPKQRMTREEIMTQTNSSKQMIADIFPSKENDSEKLAEAEMMSRSLDIASLEVELGESMRAYSKMPKQKFITASTKEYRFASYVESWRRKVEKIGRLNFPTEAKRRNLSGSLMLDVMLNSDGTVHKINVKRSSGHKLLDDSAVRIVRMASPFAPFTEDIRKEYDILHIIRTWKFLGGGELTMK